MSTNRTTGRVDGRLVEAVKQARNLAERVGLDPYVVNFWIVEHDEMNQVIAYDGFQERYPHWRWGMQYDHTTKADRYHAGKAYEIVNNDNPSNAFLQESNSIADQKAVITHVLAHADFFKNNEWFDPIESTEAGPTAMLASNGRRIRRFLDDPDIEREAVEQWIDHILCLADTIDQHRSLTRGPNDDTSTAANRTTGYDLVDRLAEMGVSPEVRDAIFDDEWFDRFAELDRDQSAPATDVLAFLRDHGKQYDEEDGRAAPMTEWQREIITLLRAEAYYFAAQRMTKVMNEGWGAYYESLMMTDEGLADATDLVGYADHFSKVLGAAGLNPYALGKHLWEYIENTTNRREVIERLLHVDGITRATLTESVDFTTVVSTLEPPTALTSIRSDTIDELATLDESYVDHDALDLARDGEIDVDRYPWSVLTYDGMAWRNYSLVKPQNRRFLSRITDEELDRIDRYLTDSDRYATVEDALAVVDHAAGWNRMLEVRASHNDVTFLDEFLTREFIEQGDYFTYEFDDREGRLRVASTEYEDIKRKLLLMFTNFGKPRISVLDGNFENRNELLLAHHYNGIMLDVEAATQTLERVFELWGRPVNLKTVVKPNRAGSFVEADEAVEELGVIIRYDGDETEVTTLPWGAVEDIVETDMNYDTTPAEWKP